MTQKNDGNRLSASDFKRLESIMERAAKKAIDAHVPGIVRAELTGIGFTVSDEGDRREVFQDQLFVRKIRKGAEAAEGIVGKRVINGALWIIGVLLMMGGGALLQKMYGH
jgi:hypothetical protein